MTQMKVAARVPRSNPHAYYQRAFGPAGDRGEHFVPEPLRHLDGPIAPEVQMPHVADGDPPVDVEMPDVPVDERQRPGRVYHAVRLHDSTTQVLQQILDQLGSLRADVQTMGVDMRWLLESENDRRRAAGLEPRPLPGWASSSQHGGASTSQPGGSDQPGGSG